MAVVNAQPPAPPSYLSVEAVHTGASVATPESAEATVETSPASAPAAAPAPTGRVSAVGDSVMLGAAGELQRTIDHPAIDAEVGLQVSAATDILREQRAAGTLGDVVVVHIGNNGPFTAAMFDEMMQALAGVRTGSTSLSTSSSRRSPPRCPASRRRTRRSCAGATVLARRSTR